jgi:hypothetical protein
MSDVNVAWTSPPSSEPGNEAAWTRSGSAVTLRSMFDEEEVRA